ncbi:MAG: glycosyltransferase [Gemmataceae bacterium]
MIGPVRVSFIIPAHNEEALIGRTLAALEESASALGESYEIIVANDSSTDNTAAIALEYKAQIITLDRRQIAATRNAGARAAKGELFIFVDADTVVTARAVRAALRAMRGGSVGGGCCVRIDGPLPTYAIILERLLWAVSPAIGLVGGCFLFCTRQAYLKAGGFNEDWYAAEEVAFSGELKRQGRFIVLREFVTTSGRKLRAHTALDMLRLGVRLVLGGQRPLRQRDGLEYWYGSREAPTGRLEATSK